MPKTDHTYLETARDNVEFREILDRYLRYWPLFLFSTLCILFCSSIYLSTTTPIFKSIASIIIKDEESNSSSKDNSFVDLGLLSGLGTNSIENELGILRSKRMMTNVVKALGLNIKYYTNKSFRNRELYLNSPFLLDVQSLDQTNLNKAINSNSNTFEITLVDAENVQVTNLETGEIINEKFNNYIILDFARFSVKRNLEYTELTKDKEISVIVQFESIDNVASLYRSKLDVVLNEENATLIMLSLEDPIKKKAEDILNQVVFEYNKEAIEDKNLIAENTAFFIDERLSIINKELDSVESGKEEFKELNSLADLRLGSELIMQNASEYNIKQQEVNTKLELVNSMIRYLSNSKSELLPSNIGIEDPGVQKLIGEYNELIIERNRVLIDSKVGNPLAVSLASQISQLRNDLSTSFKRIGANLRISRNSLQKQAGLIGSQISNVPAQERQFREIERQQNIKEALYLYLLQKREENSLALAATGPKAKIVDQAYTLPNKVSPNSLIVLFASTIFGLAFPFFYINGKKLLDNKIRNRKELNQLVRSIPVLGELPHLNSDNKIFKANNRSNLSEAFRILNANLQHTLFKSNNPNRGYSIFVTSTIKGEGKTFTTINLAMSMASSGEKVLVVGFDLRNPQINKYALNGKSLPGISNYLMNEYENLESLITPSRLHKNLLLLPSGPILPNPSELLQKKQIKEMFNVIQTKFDYIIFDTAPSMLVADTFMISNFADITLYLVRSGFTKKKLMEFVVDSNQDNKLVNANFILNDVALPDLGYGNKYGYNYGQTQLNAIEIFKLSIGKKIDYLTNIISRKN